MKILPSAKPPLMLKTFLVDYLQSAMLHFFMVQFYLIANAFDSDPIYCFTDRDFEFFSHNEKLSWYSGVLFTYYMLLFVLFSGKKEWKDISPGHLAHYCAFLPFCINTQTMLQFSFVKIIWTWGMLLDCPFTKTWRPHKITDLTLAQNC